MAITLLTVSVLFFLSAILCLFVIMIKKRMWNLHAVWDFARKGDQLSRIYVLLIGAAFILALTAEVIILSS
jgi:hypothetical protein